ncbi:MAG TPA: hypothetical protein VK960_02290 [Acidimicrobiia bacterium]|nr:hypothetical protein [Acidimicrobiia bacterium]
MRHISTEERRARVARRHLLAEPASSVEEVAATLVAFHSTDPTTVYLSARARDEGFRREVVSECARPNAKLPGWRSGWRKLSSPRAFRSPLHDELRTG